jgi:hypothetical protein
MTKIFLLMQCWLFTLVPFCSYAAWQVANPENTYPREPFFEAGAVQHKAAPAMPTAMSGAAFPEQYAKLGQAAAVYAISVSGSLKENLERIMGRYNWKVVWKAPYDYNFDGRVSGTSLPNVVEKLLKPFPLQAVMYVSNRTVMVVQR